MTLDDILGAAKRKVGRVGQYAVLGLALVFSPGYVGCGDDGSVPPEDDMETPENPCGNSPVYGKHLWEVDECQVGYHMREDCRVGKWDSEGTLYDYSSESFGGEITYDYLSLEGKDGSLYSLDREMRFVGGKDWQRANDILNRFAGYILLPNDSCNSSESDDCTLLIPLTEPFPGEDQCRSSPFYVHLEPTFSN